MTKAIKRLPAILLAVIIAAALSLAIGVSQQTVYAAEDADEYHVYIQPIHYQTTALPGGEIPVAMTIYDADYDDVTGTVLPTAAEWSIADEHKDYATVDYDSEAPWVATVNFLSLPEGQSEQTVTLKLAARIDGNSYDCETNFLMKDEFDDLVISDVIDPYMSIDSSEDFTAEVKHFTVDNPEGVAYDNTTFTWEADTEGIVQFDPAQYTGSQAAFKMTRLKGDPCFLALKATWENDGQEMEDYEFFILEEVSKDLNDYDVEIKNAPDGIVYLDEGEAFDADVQVQFGKNFILAGDCYDTVYERYVGYNEETGEDVWDTVDELKPYENGEVDPYSGDDVGGTGIFRIIAKANGTDGYEGETTDRCAYLCLYSKNTLNGGNAWIDFGEDNLQFIDEYPYLIYEVQPGEEITPKVTNCDDVDITDGVKLEYINIDTFETSESFPTESGEYLVEAYGQDPYYGQTDTWLKIGDPNPTVVKGKTVKAKAKKKTTIKKKDAFKIKNANGNIYFTKVTGNDKISVSETGIVTVKKGLKKGKTYSVKVLVSGAGDSTHLSFEKTVTVKVKVK